MRTVDVTLGGESYTIPELPTRQNEAWRDQLAKELGPIMETAKDLAGKELRAESLDQVIGPAELVVKVAMSSPTKIRDLVISYSDELKERQEVVLDRAYDSEFVEAFMAIMGLAYPFGGLVRALSQINGS